MTKTAKLYGGSLYDLAAEETLADAVLAEMEALRDVFRENPAYLRLLAEPSIAKAERLGLLDQVFAGKIQPYLLNFLKLLCENGLMREFGGCCQAFRQRYNSDHGIAEATVTSAVPMTDAQAEALRAKLEKISGKTILLARKVDARLLGGIRVEFDGQELDGTAQRQLADLKRLLTE